MSHFCVSENLSEFEEILKNGLIFDESLKLSTFLIILEILWNAAKNKKKKCRKCFPKKTFVGIKKNKKILKSLFSKKKSLDERKLLFTHSSKSFKKFVKRVLKDFTKNALEREEKSD